MAGKLITKSFEENTIILQQGQPVPFACMVMEGKVSVYKTAQGRRIDLATLGKGEIFGEMGLLSAQTASANVETSGPTTLLFIGKDSLKALLEKSPKPLVALVKHLIERMRLADLKLEEVPAKQKLAQRPVSSLQALAQILELLHSTQTDAKSEGVTAFDLYKTAKNILPLSRLEVDQMLDRLAKVNAVKFDAVKHATYGKDALGETKKTSERVVDRKVWITDPANFLAVARNLDEEAQGKERNLEFLDIEDSAALVGSNPDMLYKKIGAREIPENLFFLEKSGLAEWSGVVGKEFFQKTARKRLNLDELESVDDIVHVDNATLKQAFQELGFNNLAILFAAAEQEARDKMLANLSQKIAGVVTDEAQDREVDDAELADLEDQLFTIVRNIKGK